MCSVCNLCVFYNFVIFRKYFGKWECWVFSFFVQYIIYHTCYFVFFNCAKLKLQTTRLSVSFMYRAQSGVFFVAWSKIGSKALTLICCTSLIKFEMMSKVTWKLSVWTLWRCYLNTSSEGWKEVSKSFVQAQWVEAQTELKVRCVPRVTHVILSSLGWTRWFCASSLAEPQVPLSCMPGWKDNGILKRWPSPVQVIFIFHLFCFCCIFLLSNYYLQIPELPSF